MLKLALFVSVGFGVVVAACSGNNANQQPQNPNASTQPMGQPGQPGYAQPGQPGYAQPGQPGYAQPGQPGSGQPQPGYPAQPGQPVQPGYPQPGQTAQPVQPPQPGYPQPGATPGAPTGQLAIPGPMALPCTSDAACLTHKCNMQYGKCAFPCESDNDCVTGAYCFKGIPTGATCAIKMPGQP